MKNILIYLRILFKNKALSIINLMGLSIGLSICICIGLYVSEQLSYDSYHKNLDRIFSVTFKWETPSEINHLATNEVLLGPTLKRNYPEVEEVVRLKNLENTTVRSESKVFKENELFESDKEIFNVFTYNILQGNPETALDHKNSMVITKSFGEKYFGLEDPLNKSLIVDNRTFQITAVIEDLPFNSDIRFMALIPIDDSQQLDWFEDVEYFTFVLFDENYIKQDPTASSFQPKLRQIADENVNIKFSTKEEGEVDFLLQPLSKQHFREPLIMDTQKANAKYLYIIGSVAFLVLIIGSLNFINFSLIQSLERGKEIAIRKISGANYYRLVFQYISESVLMVFFAFCLAILFVSLGLPYLKGITGMNSGLSELWNLRFILFSLAFIVLNGCIAGVYPAFFATSMKPLDTLQGKTSKGGGSKFRNVSMTLQFSIAMGLIICTLITSKQIDYLSKYDVGFVKENIIVLDTPADTLHARQLKLFKHSLLSDENISMVSNLNYGSLPGDGGSRGQTGVKGSDNMKVVAFSRVDENYLPILGIQLIEGRNFEEFRDQDRVRSVIINETFKKEWGLIEPLNEKILWGGGEYSIIGVTEDFNLASLHSKIEPLIIFYDEERTLNTLVSFNQNIPISEQISLLSEKWTNMFPNEPFQYRFFDEALSQHYINDERIVWVFSVFSSMSIVVALLGLFGLCSLTISHRRKEIAIRKVIGASSRSIIMLFFNKYLKLIILAFILTSPFTVIAMRKWLDTFPYRVDLNVSEFFVTFSGTAVFALIIVMFIVYKALVSNPILEVRK